MVQQAMGQQALDGWFVACGRVACRGGLLPAPGGLHNVEKNDHEREDAGGGT